MGSRRKKKKGPPPGASRTGYTKPGVNGAHERSLHRSGARNRFWSVAVRRLRKRAQASRAERARARRGRNAEEPTTFDVLEQRYYPEGRGAPRRVRVRAWAVSIVLALIATVAGFAGTYAYDLWSAEARLREERAAQAALDQAGAPFTSTISYDTSASDPLKVILDRPLTSEEAEELSTLGASSAWEFLRGLGGRAVPNVYTGAEVAPVGGWSWQEAQTNIQTGSAVFTMTVMSARNSQVSIVDMTPTNVSCTKPTATTVVEYAAGGQATYPGVIVDITHDEPTLLILDEGSDQGQPYFSRRRIDLGGGLEPGGLRVHAVTAGQTCEWEIQARYVDARQNSGEVVLNNDGEPFLVESVPQRPEQHWTLFPGPDGNPVMSCRDTWQAPAEGGCPSVT